MEPTTTKWKNRKTKNTKYWKTVLGISGLSSEEEQEGYGGKEGFKPGMKEWGGDGILIIIIISILREFH